MLDCCLNKWTDIAIVAFALALLVISSPQLNATLKAEGITSDYINGMRVTTPAILRVARHVFTRANLSLCQALEDKGTRARPVQNGVFHAEFLNAHTHGYVGQVTRVDCEPVYAALRAGQLPIITCMGESETGQRLNINADVAAQELAKQLKPVKIVYLSSNGGINDENDELIRTIDLEMDYDRLMNEPWFRHGNKLKLREIKTLLDELPPSSTVAITSAANLPKELFTHKGSGTLVRRSEKINIHTSLDEINREKLIALIEESFNGRLEPRDYLDQISSKIHRVYLSESYRAVAIVTKENATAIPYLDKFAVARLSQSEGTGNNLWQILAKDCPSLFWRSRSNNTINAWYFDRAQGSMTRGDWTVFWYGAGTDLAKCQQLVEHALSKPATIDRSQPVWGEGANDVTTSTGGGLNANHSSKSGGAAGAPLQAGQQAKRAYSTLTRRSAASHSINASGARHFSSSSAAAAAASTDVKRVGLIGARGHTGVELLKIIDAHPQLTISCASSRALKGKTIGSIVEGLSPKCTFAHVEFVDLQPGELHSQGVDAWILALPNDLAKPYVAALQASNSKAKVVDLSADYRFDPSWTYGLPERHGARDALKRAQYISNPGCYATGAQLSLLPLLELLDTDSYTPTVFGVSGYSGAGTGISRKTDPRMVHDNLMPYALINHMHEREVTHQLQAELSRGVRFMPHVAPWFRGIQLTTSVQLSSVTHKREDILALFHRYYKNEPLVRVTPELPEVRANAFAHHATVGGFVLDEKNGRLVVCATLDNLLKGAATQCVQNLNLALGMPELQGIKYQAALQKSVLAA